MLPDLQQTSIVVFFILFFGGIVLALWKGAAPERYGAAVLITMAVVQYTLYSFVSPQFDDVDWISVMVDLIGVIGFGALALNANRWWPIVASSLQTISCLSHFARMVESDVLGQAYSWMKTTPTGAVALLLLVGTIMHRRRVAHYGYDQSWTDFEIYKEQHYAHPRDRLGVPQNE